MKLALAQPLPLALTLLQLCRQVLASRPELTLRGPVAHRGGGERGRPKPLKTLVLRLG